MLEPLPAVLRPGVGRLRVRVVYLPGAAGREEKNSRNCTGGGAAIASLDRCHRLVNGTPADRMSSLRRRWRTDCGRDFATHTALAAAARSTP